MTSRARKAMLIFLGLLPLVSPASESVLTKLERVTGNAPKGLPATIEVWNATPEAELTLKLHGESRVLGVEPAESPAPWFEGVTFNAHSITLKVPADTLPGDTYTTLRLQAYLELGLGSGGHIELEKPLVFSLRSAYGNATIQSGSFSFKIPALPPACVIAGCARSKQCPDAAGGTPQTCYGYYEEFVCCSISPYPAAKNE